MRKHRKLYRGLALLCAIVMMIMQGSFAAVSVDSATPAPYVTYDGDRVSHITLVQDGKMPLRAQADTAEEVGYHWQIADPLQEDYWIDISGANSVNLWVTYAMVGSMLRDDGSARVRCRITYGAEEICTAPVTVTVSFNLTERPAPIQIPATNLATPINTNRRTLLRAPRADTYSIVINYIFDDGSLAFESYGATVGKGDTFKETVPSPDIVGYAPFRQVGDDYVAADSVDLNYTNIQEDIVINVVYKPKLVNVTVHHCLQNLYDDDYAYDPANTTTFQALTGTMVGDGLAWTAAELPGFRALAYEKLIVAADGSTVVEIRYDRNYYLVDFDMAGGYGTEPIYTRYGTPVGANNPIRHGYVFNGWELISYGGETPSAEQASKYTISASAIIEVPAANLRYRARWITQNTTYTMVFWRENANDTGYSYWGYLDGLSAMSGSTVSAQDWASRCPTIDDAAYFTFNPLRSDKDVLVEGDGSTIVNVYYTRNYYTITIKGGYGTSCAIPRTHTHGADCYNLICNHVEHVHDDTCVATLSCTVPEHTVHDESCYSCGEAEHIHNSGDCVCKVAAHTHAIDCWTGVGARVTSIKGAPTEPQETQIYYRSRKYYIYLFGSWYNYTPSSAVSSGDTVPSSCKKTAHIHGTDCSCKESEHTHTDACYGDDLHSHTDACYSYSCGLTLNAHTDACYRLICPIPENHSHSTSCNAVIKLEKRKYQEDLADMWPITDYNGKVYNSGQRWTPGDSPYYKQVLVYFAKMVPDDFTLTLSTANYDTFIMHYCLQVLPENQNDPDCIEKDGKYYKESFVVRANYNYITYDEDFFEITGFNRASSSHAFDRNNQLDIPGGGDVYFYYDRGTDNPLTFYNRGEVLEDKTVSEVMYEAPLKEYNFVPDYPSTLEEGAYTFAGWYTSPGCFAGTEVDWDTIRMEDGGLQLYAKWRPITHTVRVYLDATLTTQIGTDQIVDHRAFAVAPHETVTNGSYVFQGWFYMDSADGKEKAFVFTGIPITEDMNIYAKWSSHTEVEYRVEYRLKETGEQIADPLVGKAIAGNNKTFHAKAGTELYAGYQSGYFPLTSSHTVTMNVDGVRTFVFEYIYKENVPYKVRYVDANTGLDLHEPKYVIGNKLSVVTETFVRVDGMMSDAYQKRLVLVAEGTNKDEHGVAEENTITFYYADDDQHAYYRVVHYVQNLTDNDYREYRSQENVGIIGTTYTINALTLTGFTFDGSLTRVNGAPQNVTGTQITAQLGNDGLLVELFYPRNMVSYTVRYVNYNTGEDIYAPYVGTGVFGQQIAEYALDLTSLGYSLIGEQARLMTLSANPDHNELVFSYNERTVSLKYEIVGPADCGSLSQTSQNIQAISGVANGSAPMLKPGFQCVGWYLDAACTRPVYDYWVDDETNRITPVKTGSVWQDTTYYCKVVALETDLTIRVMGADRRDENQGFVFRIVGVAGTQTENIDLTIAINGNGEATVTKLPTGDYTVTQLIDWAWRYDTTQTTYDITLEYSENGTVVTYTNYRENGQWLDGNAFSENVF